MSNKKEIDSQLEEKSREEQMKEIFDVAQAYRSELTKEKVSFAIDFRKKNKDDAECVNACIVAYLCGDEEFKQMVIDGLGEDDLAVRRGEYVLKVLGKDKQVEEEKTVEKEAKAEEKSENFVDSLSKKSKQKEGRSI